MPAPVRIVGNRAKAVVDETGALRVEARNIPADEGGDVIIPFRQFMTTDGTATGTSDMQVAASAGSPSDFYIPASTDYDLYITSLNWVIADQNAVLNTFGTITALANGCQLFWQTTDRTVTIASPLQSNFDFIRLCQGKPAFGDATTAFRAANVSGTSEGFIPILDVKTVFGMPWGFRLRRGTKQKLTFRVRDDTTGVDAFNCIAYGFERYPDFE